MNLFSSWSCKRSRFLVKFNLVVGMSLTLGLISSLDSVSCAQGANNPGKSSISTKERLEEGDSSAPSSGSSHGKYSGKSSSSPSSSYFATYPSASSYSAFYSPNSDSYYDTLYERPRQFSARSSVYPAAIVGAGTSQVGFAVEPDYAATGHGGGGHGGGGHGGGGHGGGGHGGGHGGGGGGGWGWGGGGGGGWHYESVQKTDNSSFGLLGLLGLLSLLSNVLLLITTTAAATTAAARIRRDANWGKDNSGEIEKVEKVCQMVLPSLNILGHVRNGVLPKNCSHQEVCKTNKILVNEFGLFGRTVGSKLSEAIVKMLGEIDQSSGRRGRGDYHKDKYLLKASLDGRNGHDCNAVYPTCEALGSGGDGGVLLPQLISPQHVSAIVHGENPHISIRKLSPTSKLKLV